MYIMPEFVITQHAALSRSVVSDSLRPIGCSPPGSSVHGILQARILERVAMPSSRGSSQPRDQTHVSCIAGGFFTVWATRETHNQISVQYLDSGKQCLN